MRVLLYIGVVIFGALGLLGVLRTIELAIFGPGLMPARLVVPAVFLLLAIMALRGARSRAPRTAASGETPDSTP